MVITFVAALLMPLQYAVLVGVALAVLLFVVNQSNEITVKQWQWKPGELPVESDAPEVVPANEVIVLIPFGSLFYAAAQTFEEKLPQVTEETRHAVVIISLHHKPEVGSTLLNVLTRYSADLSDHDSRLMLAGLTPQVKDQIDRTGMLQTLGRDNVFLATERAGESGLEAMHEAEKWIELVSMRDDIADSASNGTSDSDAEIDGR